MNIKSLAAELTRYEEQEAHSIVRLLLYDLFHMTLTDICTGALERLTNGQLDALKDCMQRIKDGEPVQYVTSKAEFCGYTFAVNPNVLIPRPETEGLCQLITDDEKGTKESILDIGTGSGCIAITLAKQLSHAAVTAWDISDGALQTARENAERNKVSNITFQHRDALNLDRKDKALWDVIVSNPPYICHKEKADMRENVLLHEPHLALFTPDDDPLLFYRHIAKYSLAALKPSGRLYFEINPIYTKELCAMLNDLGFQDISVHEDLYGRERFIRAALR